MDEINTKTSTATGAVKTYYPEIQKCFGEMLVDIRDLTDINYLLRLAAAAKQERELLRGEDAKKLRAALREILMTLPGMIDRADKFAATARAEGRFQGDRFPEFGRTLLNAVLPFEGYAQTHPSSRSWWHWYAQALAQEVSAAYSRARQTASFSNETGNCNGIIADLLALAGIDQTTSAIRDAIAKGK